MTQPLPEQPPIDGDDEQQSLRDRLNDRRVLAAIGGAVIVVAALGLFVVKPMVSGSSSDDSGAVVVHHHTVKPTATPSATASAPAVAATPAPQLKVRDPFSPLIAPVTAAAPPSPTTGASPSTPTIVVVQPSTAPTGTAYTLKLDKIVDANSVQVTLNGKAQTVAIGQSFPTSDGPFQLTKVVPGGPAEFTYGDQPFDMAVGETQTES